MSYYMAPNGQLMMRVMHCSQPAPMMAPALMPHPGYDSHGYDSHGYAWEERHEAAGGLIPGLGRHIPRDKFPPRPKPPPRKAKEEAKAQSAMRVAGGYKVFHEASHESWEAHDQVNHGWDVVNARYGEVAPRAAPRIEAPRSGPPPRITQKRDVDGRSFGELTSQLWPGGGSGASSMLGGGGSGAGGRGGGGSFARGAGGAGGSAGGTSADGVRGAGRRAASTDGRRYEGVDHGDFYDALLSKSWAGEFGGPFKKVGGDRPEHPWPEKPGGNADR